MKLQITRDVATSQLFWPELMGAEYDPPGVTVHEADDGTRWFRVQQAVGERILDARNDVAHYDTDDDSGDS